jgi:hypothetical protein
MSLPNPQGISLGYSFVLLEPETSLRQSTGAWAAMGPLTVGVLDPGSVIRGVGSKTFTALTSYFGCFVTKITGYMIFARAGIRGITCSSLFSLCRGSYGTTQLGGVKGDGFEGHYMSTPATPALMREGLLKMFNPVFLLHNLKGYPLFS